MNKLSNALDTEYRSRNLAPSVDLNRRLKYASIDPNEGPMRIPERMMRMDRELM